MRHEPLLDQYTLLTINGRQRRERRYATLDALGAALAWHFPRRPDDHNELRDEVSIG